MSETPKQENIPNFLGKTCRQAKKAFSTISKSSHKTPRPTKNAEPASTPNWPETIARQRLDANPKLSEITASAYITFVDALCEDALWRLESRLIYTKFNHIPRDAYKNIFDDHNEGMPWYSFLKDPRNGDIMSTGCVNISENYQNIFANRPRPAFESQTFETIAFDRSAGPRGHEEAANPQKTDGQVRFNNIGKLLTEAGYKPQADPRNMELSSDQYPDSSQYYTDLTAFLETILCLLIATCPQVRDYEQIVDLIFNNYNAHLRGLKFENNHLVIVSYNHSQAAQDRIAIPSPLSRIILIYLIEIRPFLLMLKAKPYERKHWRSSFLFPSRSGGPWAIERADRIFRREARAKMGADIGLEDFKAVYHNLKGQLGEGWLREVPYWLHGEKEPRVEIKWSVVSPDPPNQQFLTEDGYVAKYVESSWPSTV
ncbi:hypothetical protein ABW21_db0204092 [Orbilia brochopaga]|nr:hypothetical protein ABW21_db0204092 [Drechslerella brochopaga]